LELLAFAVRRVLGGGAHGYVVEGSGHRGSGPGRWWLFEAAASISFAAAALWGGVVAPLGFWVAFLGLRGRQGRRPGWFVFGLCEGCPGCYVGAAAPKARCLGGDLEICVDSEFVDPAGSSSGNAKVVLDGTSGWRPRS
jgi:hypothetical protein